MALPTKVKYRAFSRDNRHRFDGEQSMYSHACPTCGAPAWHHCNNLKGTHLEGGYHRARGANAKLHTPLPDMRAWWEEMKQYEGLHPKPRPADLEV